MFGLGLPELIVIWVGGFLLLGAIAVVVALVMKNAGRPSEDDERRRP